MVCRKKQRETAVSSVSVGESLSDNMILAQHQISGVQVSDCMPLGDYLHNFDIAKVGRTSAME